MTVFKQNASSFTNKNIGMSNIKVYLRIRPELADQEAASEQDNQDVKGVEQKGASGSHSDRKPRKLREASLRKEGDRNENGEQNAANNKREENAREMRDCSYSVVAGKSGKRFVVRTNQKHFNERQFEFEEVFGSDTSQQALFGHFEPRLCESALQGVN